MAPADESLGLFDNHLTNPAARSALMLLRHCAPTDGAEIFERLGGPIVELPEASADEGGQALEGEGEDSPSFAHVHFIAKSDLGHRDPATV